MEILQQVGVAHRITENGLPWHCGTSITVAKKSFAWKRRKILTIALRP
jgi:3-(3-hydroxy-phenyl)propionate hydroxylase